jgi:hypothetical protein
MFLRLPEPELRELISAFLRCLKENINKGVVMFTGLRFPELKMLKCLDKAVWDFMVNHHQDSLYFCFCFLSFPQNERKMYKLRRLSLSHFFEHRAIYVYFYKLKFFVKVNIDGLDGSACKKYTKCYKLSCLSLFIFLSF